jgi:hypothetical protein
MIIDWRQKNDLSQINSTKKRIMHYLQSNACINYERNNHRVKADGCFVLSYLEQGRNEAGG